jgi:hypothetical protein
MFVGLERSFKSAELISVKPPKVEVPLKKEKRVFEKEGISGVISLKYSPLTGRVSLKTEVLSKSNTELELQVCFYKSSPARFLAILLDKNL